MTDITISDQTRDLIEDERIFDEEVKRILSLTDEEVAAELRELGIDPEEEVARLRRMLSTIIGEPN